MIEAIVTVAIIGIITAVAWPVFDSQLQSMHRRDAVSALTTASNKMQQCKTDNGSYSACAGVVNPDSPNGRYTVSVTIPNSESYTLTATENAGDDSNCTKLTLNNLGIKSCTGNFNTANPNQCYRCWGE